MRRKLLATVLAIIGLAAVLHGAAGSGEWTTYTAVDAPAAVRPMVQRGDLLIVSLQTALLSELRRELAAGSPAEALTACHIDATAVAYRIARDQGIAVGRTSARLRNPTNAPRPWAAPIVARYADRPAAGIDGFVVDLGDRVGLLRPIVEQSACAPCHGLESRVDTRVRALLPASYPADRALGFKDGDVRGWFWVEMPKR